LSDTAAETPAMTRRPAASGTFATFVQLAVFAISHGLTVAAFMVVVRWNLGSGIPSALASFAHLAGFLGCVLAGARFADRRSPGNAAAGVMLGGLAGYLLPLTGLLAGPLLLALPVVAAGLGATLAARSLAAVPPARLAILAVGGVLSGVLFAITLNGGVYAHVFADEFTLMGIKQRDTVFHAAIANMIAGHLIPGVGADGIVPTFYHIGSHYLVAGISREAGELALSVYPAAQQIFFLPALIFASAGLVAVLARFEPGRSWIAPFAILLVWMLSWPWTFNSFRVSESYTVSLGLFCLSAPFALRGPGRNVVAWLPGVALAGVFILAAKMTLTFAWLAVCAYGLWQVVPARFRWALLAVVGFGYLCVLGALLLSLGGISAVSFLHFPSRYFPFFIVEVAIVVLGIGALLLLRRQRPMLSAPGLAVVALLLYFPALFLNDGGSGAYYWFNPSTYLAMVAIAAALVATAFRLAGNRADAIAVGFVAVIAGSLTVNASAIAAGSLFFAKLRFLEAYARSPADAAPFGGFVETQSAAIEAALQKPAAEPGASDGAAGSAIREAVGALPLSRLREDIRGLGGDAARAAIYIPPGEAWFWDISPDCMTQALLAPATIGLPMIRGLPPESRACPPASGYGLARLGDSSRIVEADDATVCGWARERGFAEVIIVRERVPRLLACP